VSQLQNKIEKDTEALMLHQHGLKALAACYEGFTGTDHIPRELRNTLGVFTEATLMKRDIPQDTPISSKTKINNAVDGAKNLLDETITKYADKLGGWDTAQNNINNTYLKILNDAPGINAGSRGRS